MCTRSTVAVRRTVQGRAPVPASFTSPSSWPATGPSSGRPPAWTAQLVEEQPVIQPTLVPGAPGRAGAVPMLRVLGQVGATYIVAEGPDGLYLVDQHAAHERVLYERMMAEREEGVPSQRLLQPAPVEVPAETTALVEGNLETLRQLGFDLELFGGATFLVRSLPAVLARSQPAEVISEVGKRWPKGAPRWRKRSRRP